MKPLIAALMLVTLLGGCSSRDGQPSMTGPNTVRNDGQHVAYGTTDVRLFDMVSPEGHKCTVAATDNNQGGVAMHCWSN
jgi:hypothetical protein